MTVVTAANDAYVLPLAVMLRSLTQSLGGQGHVDARILSRGLSRARRKQLDDSMGSANLDLREVRVDPALLAGLKVDGHVSLETYFRLLTPSYVTDVGTVLYLDADLLVRHSVLDLYRLPLEDAHLLAVPHANVQSAVFSGSRGVPAYSMLGIPGHTRTFNAGVMVLDLERWRQSGVTDAVLTYLRRYSAQVLWWDQDGLNAVLHARWRPLAAFWNVTTSLYSNCRSWEESMLDAETFETLRRDPGIVHYSSAAKPWMPGYGGPFLDHWRAAALPIAQHFKELGTVLGDER